MRVFRLHITTVKVYQVLDPKNMYSDIGRTLVDQKRVSAHARGWFIFNVTRAVRDWAFQKAPNHGFLVISKALYGQDLGEADVRFAQRKAHHDTKQPILWDYYKTLLFRKNLDETVPKELRFVQEPAFTVVRKE
ncbi:hypothetical protein MAR_028866 [Mya arenaria]|uniref:TGF-beta propeptide domain-containing protein n=1 Tax=Mya arenaria TaxID=6604 RepID=A0ABY7DGS1_MYAAR|nr:hypothetical protein MAR_028866 [Mya arenaria]